MAIKVVGKPTLQLFKDDKLVKEHIGKNAFNVNVLDYNNIQTILDETTFYLTDTAYTVDINEMLFDGTIIGTAGFKTPKKNSSVLHATKIEEESGTVITDNKIIKTFTYEWLPSQAIGKIERINSLYAPVGMSTVTSLQLPIDKTIGFGLVYADENFNYYTNFTTTSPYLLQLLKKNKKGDIIASYSLDLAIRNQGKALYDYVTNKFYLIRTTNNSSSNTIYVLDNNFDFIEEINAPYTIRFNVDFIYNSNFYNITSSGQLQENNIDFSEWTTIVNALTDFPKDVNTHAVIKIGNKHYFLGASNYTSGYYYYFSLYYIFENSGTIDMECLSKLLGFDQVSYLRSQLYFNYYATYKNNVIFDQATFLPVTWHNLATPIEKTVEESMKMIYEIEIIY